MSRLTRIVCDGPYCTKQNELFSSDYNHQFYGSEDTPDGWLYSRYQPPKVQDAVEAKAADTQPLHFCSRACMADFGKKGERKMPFTGGETVYPATAE